MFIVIQEGGTSTELYASTFDTSEEAANAVANHGAASYYAQFFEVPAALARLLTRQKDFNAEVDLTDLVTTVLANWRRD